MNNLLVTMSVAGHERYFEFADLCISSFIKNCPSTKMAVFTDRVDYLKKYNLLSKNIEILDFKTHFDQTDMINIKRQELYNMVCEDYNDPTYNHNHIFVAAVLPMAQKYAMSQNQIDYILKIDCDGVFAGGDLFSVLKKDIKKYPGYDLYLVQRTNPLMGFNGRKKLPGVGFTLWNKHGKFINKYNKYFEIEEQRTILNLGNKIKTKILKRPGYHFVFPFQKCQPDVEYTKEKLEEFLPAYFHVHEKKHFDMLSSWFS